jgi:UDP-glucose 4-epimerase
MKERVLITGASGFVGFHLIEEALKNNLDVYAAVRKSSDVDHLKDLPITYVYPDFNNPASLAKEISEKQYNYIIHAAGVTKALSAKEYDDINAGYTYNLALAANESSALKKFVLISSLAAVGPLNTLDGIITDQTIPHPVTSYGRSKLLAEEKLKTISSLNYTILRPTGVYGPRDRDIFIFFKQLTNRIEPYIGYIDQKLSFIYVADLAKASIQALHSGNNNNTYNLSDGNGYNRYELGRLTKEYLNLHPLKFHLPVNFVKLIANISEKYSSLSNKASVLNREKLNELMAVNWSCDIGPAKSDLGFSPAYNLGAGVAATLKWYKSNKWL